MARVYQYVEYDPIPDHPTHGDSPSVKLTANVELGKTGKFVSEDSLMRLGSGNSFKDSLKDSLKVDEQLEKSSSTHSMAVKKEWNSRKSVRWSAVPVRCLSRL